MIKSADLSQSTSVSLPGYTGWHCYSMAKQAALAPRHRHRFMCGSTFRATCSILNKRRLSFMPVSLTIVHAIEPSYNSHGRSKLHVNVHRVIEHTRYFQECELLVQQTRSYRVCCKWVRVPYTAKKNPRGRRKVQHEDKLMKPPIMQVSHFQGFLLTHKMPR